MSHASVVAPAPADLADSLSTADVLDVLDTRPQQDAAEARAKREARAPNAPGAPSHNAVAMVVTMSDVGPEAVRWLWPGYIPLGKLTVLEGDPGLGKSTLALAIAAAVSRGLPLPGGAPTEPAHVVLISYEDALADTLRPRLDAAGADVTRVHAITGMRVTEDVERLVTLPADGRSIFDVVQQYGARLVVVDTLTCALASDTDSHRDADVRRALAPLAKLAQETGAAVVVIRHLRKSGGSAIVSGGGSIGIGGAARSVLGVYADPDEEDACLLAVVKANLARRAPTLRYRLVSENEQAARVEWGGASHLTADHLAGLRLDDGEGEGSHRETDDWLRSVLEVAPLDRRDVLRLGTDAGFSTRTVQRAAVRIGVHKDQAGFGTAKRSTWSLGSSANRAEHESMARMAGLEESGTVEHNAARSPKCALGGAVP
jgi:hypothetical protein